MVVSFPLSSFSFDYCHEKFSFSDSIWNYFLTGCDALGCAVCTSYLFYLFLLCRLLVLNSETSFPVFLTVYVLSFWKYCHVWKDNLLVLGNCSYSIFFRYMGIVSSSNVYFFILDIHGSLFGLA